MPTSIHTPSFTCVISSSDLINTGRITSQPSVLVFNEAAMVLGVDIDFERARRLPRKTLDFMRDRLVEYQKETGNNYNLEATPAEGTTYRLAQIDKAENFPDRAHFANGLGAAVKHPFYTNSATCQLTTPMIYSS